MTYSRREMIQMGVGLTGSAISMGSLRGSSTIPSTARPAKSLIQIWLWGGACHIDTFDPKPDAGSDYCGPYTNPLTSAAGYRIGQSLPKLAQQSNDFSIVRSLTHGVNAHETASYLVQTGHHPGGFVHPSIGAVLSHRYHATTQKPSIIPP